MGTMPEVTQGVEVGSSNKKKFLYLRTEPDQTGHCINYFVSIKVDRNILRGPGDVGTMPEVTQGVEVESSMKKKSLSKD